MPQYPGYQQHPYPDYEDSSTGRLREIPVIHESSQPNQYYQTPTGIQDPHQPRMDTPPKQPQVYNVQQPERMSPHQGRSSPLSQQGRSSPKGREIPVRHIGPTEQPGYPPQGAYPQQGPYPGHPPQQMPYPPQGGGYPPQQSTTYPPPPQGYQRPVATYQQGPYPDMSEQSRQGGYPEQGYPYSSSSQGTYPSSSQQAPGSERIIPIQRMPGTQPSAPLDPRPDYPGHNLKPQQQPESGQGNSGPQGTYAQMQQQSGSESPQQYRASPKLTKQQGTEDAIQSEARPTQSETEPKERPVPAPRKRTQKEIIEAVAQEVASFQESVNLFSGTKTDKQYKYLEEMLTRNLLKLDDIVAGDNEDIRTARKLAVKEITASLDQLELKAFAFESEQTEQNTSKSAEAMDTGSSDSRSKEEGKTKDPSRVSEMVLNSEISC